MKCYNLYSLIVVTDCVDNYNIMVDFDSSATGVVT